MKTYLVVGLGVSGASVVEVLRAQGEKVLTADDKKTADYSLAQIGSPDFDYTPIDCVITSPGFKPTTDFIVRATDASVPVISDVELAWRLHEQAEQAQRSGQQWIGITGTNGKTTTTEMTEAIMRSAGRASAAVGNIGNPIVPAVASNQLDTIVAELSSFQLHYTDSVTLDCAAITNLADDHLDWHGGFDNYAADKAKVYNGTRLVMVYNADDERVTQLATRAWANRQVDSCALVGFTLKQPREGQVGIENGWIVNRSSLPTQGLEKLAPVSSFTHLTELDGSVYPHLLADALCALCLSVGAGVDVEHALEALQAFAPSGHRIQTVAVADTPHGDIRFVDDSKATNAHAAAASLSSYGDASVVWIAGGLAKGAEFGQLVRNQHHVMAAAVIIGCDQKPMLDAFAQYAPQIPLAVIDPDSSDNEPIMQQAVQAAARYAQERAQEKAQEKTQQEVKQGKKTQEAHEAKQQTKQEVQQEKQQVGQSMVVLMAPACASMDQFVSYADRGDQFAHYAHEWVNSYGK